MPSLSKLFPKKRVSWFIWVVLVVIAFPFYYFDPDFYQTYRQEYQEGWKRCVWEANSCAVTYENLEFFYTVPKYITDFWAMPLTVKVRYHPETVFKKDQVQEDKDIVVSLILTPTLQSNEVSIYLQEDGIEQNTATLSPLPPGGEAMTTFFIRANHSTSQKYGIQLYAYGNPVSAPLAYQIQIDREEVFKLWLIKHFLTPPGANIIIPLGTVLLVWLGECGFILTQQGKKAFFKIFGVGSFQELYKQRKNVDIKKGLRVLFKENCRKVVVSISLIIGVKLIHSYVRTIWPNLINQVMHLAVLSLIIGIVLSIICPCESSENGENFKVDLQITQRSQNSEITGGISKSN